MTGQHAEGYEAKLFGVTELFDEAGLMVGRNEATPDGLMVVALGHLLDTINRLTDDELEVLFVTADQMQVRQASVAPRMGDAYGALARIYGLALKQRRERAAEAETHSALQAMGEFEHGTRHLPAPTDQSD
jgi:hypothetical protein